MERNQPAAAPSRLVREARAARAPQKDKGLSCPRCDSSNTEFCYYNNYSMSQPRYFCRMCHRYWTQGGMLRRVPVGGGCRRNKRTPAASSPAAESTPSAAAAPTSSAAAAQLFMGAHGGDDLGLAPFPSSLWNHPGPGNDHNADAAGWGGAVDALSAMELLRIARGCYLSQLEMPAVGEYAAAGFALRLVSSILDIRERTLVRLNTTLVVGPLVENE